MKKRTMNLLGHDTEVTDVEITERRDRGPIELHLEDGSILHFTAIPTQVTRLDGQYGPDGTPIYIISNGVNVNVVYSPDELKKRLA